jgi:methionine aminotransferase
MQRSFEIYLPKDTNRSGIADYYLEQRNYLLSLLEGKPIGYIPVQGTYFQWIDLSFLNKQISDVELAKEWALNAGCAMIPFSPFMENTHSNRSLLMRLCFAKSKEKMDKGMKNLYQYLGI